MKENRIQHYWFQCGYCGIVCRITALSRKICWHFFPFCSPLWELEDKIASITATTASFRLSEQSLYLQHHASLMLSHGLVENFDGSFVFIWGPRAKGNNVIATSFQRATCNPRLFESLYSKDDWFLLHTAMDTVYSHFNITPLCFRLVGSPWKLTKGYNYSF